jgi:hypothetical protein
VGIDRSSLLKQWVIDRISQPNRIIPHRSSIEIESQLDEPVAPLGVSSWALLTLQSLQIYTTAGSKVSNMEYYVVAFLAKITLDNLLVLISTYTGLDKNQVVSDEEFENILESGKILIGIELTHQHQDFQTWITMTCLNYKFDSLNLVNFGIMIAKTLNTEVAIEDPLWQGDPQVSSRMIISPTKTYRKAYFYQSNEYICSMEVCKEENDLLQVIQELSPQEL